MGRLYYTYYDNEIYNEIFSTEPYTSFLVNRERSLSFRHLFEYALTFYKTADASLRVAEWYATEILTMSNDSASFDTIAAMKAIVREQINYAERDLYRLDENEASDSRVARILNRMAVLSGNMFLTGDTTFGDPDSAFKKAIDAAITSGRKTQIGFANYNYAAFLVKAYGESRKDQIIGILKDFYSNKYSGTSVVDFLAEQKEISIGVPFSAHEDIVLLGKIDPEFKTYLISLGWGNEEF
jgi:hypothetical protein